jgi:hypothetical protein
MSSVAHRAFAPVPSASSFEGLTKRLLALRVEIDAILAELANQAMAMQRAEASAAPPARELLPVLSDPLMNGEPARKAHAMAEDVQAASEPSAGEHATGEFLETSQIVGFAAPEQSISDATALEPVEVEQKTRDHAEQTSDDLTPIAAIDTEHADATSQCLEAEVSPTADMSAEQPGDAAILDAPLHSSAESIQSEEARHEPASLMGTGISAADGAQTSDTPATQTTAAGKALAEAAVIPLHTRQRKQKGELAIRAPRSVRSGRHLAAKIAACILVLLTAATILVMADRTAMGSVQSFPWMSPMPSGPTATDGALQGDRRGAAPASDDAAAIADLPPLSDGILMRYRETWPSGS